MEFAILLVVVIALWKGGAKVLESAMGQVKETAELGLEHTQKYVADSRTELFDTIVQERTVGGEFKPYRTSEEVQALFKGKKPN